MSKDKTKFKIQNQIPTRYISTQHNDQLSKLKGLDVEELLIEIEYYFLNLRKSLGISNDITFGMEIEFENAFYSEVEQQLSRVVNTFGDNYWELKSDGSVDSTRFGKDCGGEITTPILNDDYDSWIELDRVCKMLIELEATAENKAGGHIHFGTQILGDEPIYWINLMKLWTIYEKIIYRFSFGDKLGARENMDGYAIPISSRLFSILPSLQEEIDFKSIIKALPSHRYQAVNFKKVKSHEFANNNTIEFRCPNSSLNPVVWQNNINLFSKMFLYCKSNGFDSDFMTYKLRNYSSDDCTLVLYHEVYLQEALELSDLIFSNNLDKIYFLRQYLKGFENIRKKNDNVKKIKL